MPLYIIHNGLAWQNLVVISGVCIYIWPHPLHPHIIIIFPCDTVKPVTRLTALV